MPLLGFGNGAEICRGALMTGRFLRFVPLRNEILSRSSDMAALCVCAYLVARPFIVVVVVVVVGYKAASFPASVVQLQ